MSGQIDLFKKIFTNAFSIDGFTMFVKEFFNDLEIVRPDKFMNDGWNWSEFNFYIKGYYHIGNFVGSDKSKVTVLAVELKDYKNIDRARSMQRNFVKKLMTAGNADGAIVAFYASGEVKWRLSFVRMDYEFAKGKVTEELTPAKRYSYLVGQGEPCHTAQERLFPIFRNVTTNPTLDDIEDAFSVEKVTKEFFERYKEKYFEVKEHLEQDEDFVNEAKRHNFTAEQFAKKLMGQIAFLYFVQKKGWLGVNAIPKTLTEKEYKNAFYSQGKASREVIAEVYKQVREDEYKLSGIANLSEDEELVLSRSVKGMPWGTGPKDFMRKLFETCNEKGLNFFDDYLEPLFYEALNENRGEAGYFTKLHCRVPFLNGGLFEPLDNYDWNHNDFHLKNEIFSNKAEKGARDADGILDIFDRYNFTMNEDEPLEREVAIDPEMLGKIFENLLDGSERKSKGAFYTPREIVHYMCQESLANYLVNETGIAYEDIKDFIIYGEFMKDEDTSRESKQGGDMHIPESIFSRKKGIDRLRDIDNALTNIKVADPSVGSGAFPLGMVSEIVKIRKNITSYLALNMNEYQIKMMHEIDRHPYKLKIETIKNSIFAVDIDASAIDITKLRLWLSLVVEQQTNENVENELFIEGRNPRPLPNLDCNIRCGNSLIDEFEGIKLVNESTLFGDDEVQMMIGQNPYEGLLKQLFDAQDKLFYENNHQNKEETKKKIRNIIDTIIMFNMNSASPDTIKKYNESKNMPSPPWFVWQLEFAKVFKDKGGFDIVIGNPPYVGESGNKEIFRPIAATEFGREYYQGKMDLFYFFFHKGLDILKQGGFCGLITTNYYLNAAGAKTLRKDIKRRATVLKLINFNELKIFNSALGQHNIITFLSKGARERSTECCITARQGNVTPDILHSIVYWQDTETIYFNIEKDKLYDEKGNIEFHPEDAILVKMIEKSNYQFDKKCIGNGIDILQECVTDKHILIDNTLTKNAGIFAISEDEVLIQQVTDSEKKLLKPYYTGEQIGKYAINGKNKKWIIYTDKEACNNIEKYPNIINHLDKYRKIITSDNKPYGLHRARDKKMFEGEKILSLRMTKEPCFTLAPMDTFVTRAYLVIKPFEKLNYSYLVGILNSKLIHYWLLNKGKRKGKQLQVDKDQILELPIYLADEDMQNRIAELVKKIMNNIEIKNNVEEINQLVYQIYGLTEEEINKVEEI